MIELSGVSFSYRSGIVRRTTAAVVDVSLRVREGRSSTYECVDHRDTGAKALPSTSGRRRDLEDDHLAILLASRKLAPPAPPQAACG